MEKHFFADPDPESQNLTDPTDPKHLKVHNHKMSFLRIVHIFKNKGTEHFLKQLNFYQKAVDYYISRSTL